MDKLKEFHLKIDEINSQILNLIVKRNQIVKKVFEYKKQNNLPIYNPKREKETYEKYMSCAKNKNLDKFFVHRLFKTIMEQSKKEQKNAR